MGIQGLSTYLRQNKRALAKSLEFTSTTNGPPTQIIVDGWGFIYYLHHHANLPWVYGGEYEELSKLVATVVQAWIDVRLKLFFVFDGAFPRLKFDTLIDRLVRSKIQPSLLFFRTSSTSRSTPRFLNESRIIPPLFYTACVHALQILALSTDALEIHFADEEGDPYAVELAGRVRGYVVGLDSDFAILNSEEYLGYIPLDEMVWSASSENNDPAFEDDDGDDGDGDDDFQVVKGSKEKKIANDHAFKRGIIPPDVPSGLTLSVDFYSPSSLASHFDLPVSLLPLLGAFVGNDFSKSSFMSSNGNAQSRFFERHLTPSQRIHHVASTLRSILPSPSQKRKQKQQVGSVMDLIDRTVSALLNRSISSMGSGEVKEIVDKVVEATLQYAIPKFDRQTGQDSLWSTEICALHEPEVCPILPFFSRLVASVALATGEESEGVVQRDTVRRLYLTAYRKGELSPQIMNILSTGTYWPKFFLENPDLETVSRCIGRQIRRWGYSILEDAVGLPDTEDEPPEEEDGSQEQDEDENELIDVEEENSDEDPLAPFRGELKRLHDSEDEATDVPRSIPSQPPLLRHPQPKIVTEYIRRGTRVAQDMVIVPALPDLLSSILDFDTKSPIPLQLRSEEERLRVLLCAVESDTALVRDLPREHLMAALALRLVVRAVHSRANESGGSKEKERERWTKHEAQSFLASFSWPSCTKTAPQTMGAHVPPVDERNIQLMAQALMALESIEYLSQILLLSNRVPTIIHGFSGKVCHSDWTGVNHLNAEVIPCGLWDACVDGLEEAVFSKPKQKTKRGKKAKEIGIPMVPVARKGLGGIAGQGGLFGLLDHAEA